MPKGEVTYEIRADDSNLETDLKSAQKKVEQSSEKSADKEKKIEKEKSESIKQEQKSVTENHKNEKQKQEKASQDSAKTFKQLAKSISTDVKESASKAKDHASKSIEAIKHPIKTVSSFSKEKTADIKESFSKAFETSKEKAISGMEKTAKTILHPVQSAKDAGEGIKEHFGGAFEKVKGFAAETVKSIDSHMAITIGSAAAVSASIIGIGVSSVKSAVSMDQAMNQFIASTGKGKEETERYQNVLENIYKNNYGESFEDIGQAMAEVSKQLGDMDDKSLQEVTESAFVLRDTFEYEIPESTRAAKAMMDNFGVDGNYAMNLIAAGAQNGLDYSGELLDSISEYSVQFEKVGLDADDMFKIFQKGADTGAWNLDKIGDAVKEMSIRVIDGSETTKEGFETIGLNADEMSAKFAAGGDSAKEAFQQTIDALADMEDPLAQNTAGVDLFGTMWEDLGPEVVTQLASIEDGAYDTADAMNGIKEVKYDDLGSMFEGLKRTVELLLLPLGEQLIPLLSEIIDGVLPLIESILPPLIECISAILQPVLELIESALVPLVEALMPIFDVISSLLIPILEVLMSVFSEVFKGIAKHVTDKISIVKDVLSSIIDFIKNVFTGNWKGAWKNVVDIFKTIISGIANIFKAPINVMIDGINGFIKGLNKIEVPDWVPGVGGKGFHIDTIPRLRVGMDYVPSDDFPALLHKGEAVLTAQENALYQSVGGFEGVMLALSTPQGGGDTYVTVQNEGNTTEFNYQKMGEATAYALEKAGIKVVMDTREFGRLVREVQK